uniref:Uncharacterized protein n=1 Tax=Tanacetum cinerariifolium TaxID=118510 RepID=A0A6L2LQK2_TANCI|nr:hypothetical protein [Tanacetum cinerariifolium]
MANQEQNLPQKESPFVAAKQVSFNIEDIILNTNNEVAHIDPEHNNKEYFKCVYDFISKCCLRKPFTRSPNMYREYLTEFWYSAQALEHSKVSFLIPTGGISGVGVNAFRNAIEVSAKGTLKKSLLPPSWRLLMAHIIQCLGGKIGGFDQVTNKDAITLYSLANSIYIDYALKPNQPKEPSLIDHMLAICALDKLVVFKTPKTSSRDKSVSQGAKLRAKTRHKKPATSFKQPSVSSKKATKGESSKAPTGSKTGHSKRRKESSSTMNSNPSQPLVSIHMDTEMHKEDQQATGGLNYLGVTSEERANPQLSSNFIAKADPGLSAPNDSIPPQQGMDEGTKNTSYDHISTCTDPHGASSTSIHGDKEEASTAIHGNKEEAFNTIKLEDIAKLVSQIQPSFKDLNSPEDDLVIIVDESDEDEPNAKTKDTLVPRSSSPRCSQIQELTNQVLILQSQKHKLKLEKNKAEAEVALLKAQPSFTNVEQLNELLVKSLETEFSKIVSFYDFSSSLPTELKDLPSKFNELTEEIKGLKTQVHKLRIKLPKEMKEILTKLEDSTKTATSLTSQVAELKTLQWELLKEFLSLPAKVESAQAKLKSLDALPSLFLNVIKALNKFAEVLESTSTKAGDQSIPSAGQADTMPAEGEKDTNQTIIS